MQWALQSGPAMCQPVPQQADSFTADELVCALDPKCGSEHVIRRRRGLKITEAETPTRIAPAFFNNITFEFGSAELTPEARAVLDRIGEALNNPKLRTLDYRIEGHTDAKGSAAYNQALSERRAQAVRDYLIAKHSINEHRLAAVGFGKTQTLPNPPAPSPYAAINRRVQFSWVGLQN
jgi:outer membrane protein OmpA-like peptidoglycan-associated protein